MRRHLLDASALHGEEVRDRDGAELGRLEELMIDVESGRLAYAVVATGKDAGERLLAIPWSLLSIHREGGRIVLDAAESALAHAPAFTRGERPDLSDPELGSRIHAHYRVPPYWEGLAGQPR